MWWICADCKKRNLQHREFCACGGQKPIVKGFAVAASVAAILAGYTPAWADFEKQVVLNITIVTPQGMPDIQRSMPVADLKACWASAADFAGQDLEQVKAKFPNAMGVAAGCGVLEKPSVKN